MDEQVNAQETVEPVVQQPKMLSQDQVNAIVAREKSKAAESARRETEERYQREIETINAQQQQRNANVSRETDNTAISQQVRDEFNRSVEEHKALIQKQQLEEQMRNVANSYLEKVASAKPNYEDFDEVTKDFDPSAFPQITYLLSGIDNAGDILYDLAKNPLKIAGIDRLAEKNPRQAHAELLKLSRSIAENRQAQSDAQTQNVSEPLDRIAPSRIAGSNGKMGVRDLRNQPWLRG